MLFIVCTISLPYSMPIDIGLNKSLSAFSVHSEPHILYKLPKRSKLEKFEDALLCQSPLVSESISRYLSIELAVNTF